MRNVLRLYVLRQYVLRPLYVLRSTFYVLRSRRKIKRRTSNVERRTLLTSDVQTSDVPYVGHRTFRRRTFLTSDIGRSDVGHSLRRTSDVSVIVVLLIVVVAGCVSGANSAWRQATAKELKALIPARATVEKERIETEMRTASGVTDGRGKFIAAVLLITAGYSAEGKYSHLLITQVAIRVGHKTLGPGEYVFGYQRVDGETLEVKLYQASTGVPIGVVRAQKENRGGPIQSVLITPPGSARSVIQIGRFFFEYQLAE